jgi:outer membrane protein assembly factor BamB
VLNGAVYVGSYDGNVYALNAATGAKLWSYPTSAIAYSSPTVVNGMVYVSSLDGNLHAFRLPGGLATPARPSPGNLHPNDSLRTQLP